MSSTRQFGPRFSDALMFAAELHAGQVRKGTEVPYVSHLLGVAELAIQFGADEDVAITALLHDGPEDQGGVACLDEIRARFGRRVADMVAECTDTFEDPKPDWLPRKQRYVSRLGMASDGARLVVAADKVHNVRSILADHRAVGDAVFDRFTPTRAQTLWFYRAVADTLCVRGGNRLFSELQLEVRRLEALGTAEAPGPDDDGLDEAVGDLVRYGESLLPPEGVTPATKPRPEVHCVNVHLADRACRAIFEMSLHEMFGAMAALGSRPTVEWKFLVEMGWLMDRFKAATSDRDHDSDMAAEEPDSEVEPDESPSR